MLNIHQLSSFWLKNSALYWRLKMCSNQLCQLWRSVTINTERHVQVLGEFWTALGRRRGVVRALQWFQQDGATPHTSNELLAWLRQRFPDRLISRRCDPEWSPHSPNLNSPDFYLWGHLKDRVYGGSPQTIPALKAAIAAVIRAIPKQECGMRTSPAVYRCACSGLGLI